MSAVGSLVFCTDCGNLLESSTGNKNSILVCDCCGAENKGLSQCSFKCLSAHFVDCGPSRYCFEDYYNNDETRIISFSVETKEINVANCREE
ncbi:hypothetical protein CJF31_00001347 [Rutstroemia sp. NJR-2017a BVV2]|nr:hypothetical protein CJF31_00001347 [Rutstroemia sp. NJR-2017a BVV2]